MDGWKKVFAGDKSWDSAARCCWKHVDDRDLKIRPRKVASVSRNERRPRRKSESGKWKKLNGQFMGCHFHTISLRAALGWGVEIAGALRGF